MSTAMKERMVTLFYEGHSPSTAHAVLRREAADNAGGQLYKMADRKTLPTYNSVWRHHKKFLTERYGKYTGALSINEIASAIQGLADASSSKIKSSITDDGNLVISVITPLVERVHLNHPQTQSGELVFIDSTGGMDRYNMRVFLMMTSSSLGGLPLACFLTNSERHSAIEEALKLTMSIIPPGAFYGRNELGTQIIMTDHSASEKEAIHAVFPQAKQYLCIFHVLQATWRQMWDKKTGILKEHRPHILNLMKSMIYSTSEESLEQHWQSVLEDDVLTQYDSLMSYFTSYWDIRHEWAICYRKETLIRGSHTNNLVERAFLTLKDNILRRQMVFNVVQLVDYVDVFSRYFSHSIVEKLGTSSDSTETVIEEFHERTSDSSPGRIHNLADTKERFLAWSNRILDILDKQPEELEGPLNKFLDRSSAHMASGPRM